MRDLRGKRVLITGAAQGIGRALALRFAREQCALLLTDLDEARLATTVGSAREIGADARPLRLDVTDLASIERAREEILRESGPPDLLVNNAGVVFGGALLDVPLDRHVETYRVNLLGLVAVTHAFLPDLLTRPEAHIVNVASASGLLGMPFGATYASSKWGVIGFTDSLRLELRRLGHRHVGVTALCPSYVDTGLFHGARLPRGTRLLTAERIADAAIAAVRRNRARWLSPALVKLIPPVRGLLPVRWFDLLAGLFGVHSGMGSWKGRKR